MSSMKWNDQVQSMKKNYRNQKKKKLSNIFYIFAFLYFSSTDLAQSVKKIQKIFIVTKKRNF